MCCCLSKVRKYFLDTYRQRIHERYRVNWRSTALAPGCLLDPDTYIWNKSSEGEWKRCPCAWSHCVCIVSLGKCWNSRMTTKLNHLRAFNQKQAIIAQVITSKRFFLERPYGGSNYCTLSGPHWDQSEGCGGSLQALQLPPNSERCFVEWQQTCLWALMLVLGQVATSFWRKNKYHNRADNTKAEKGNIQEQWKSILWALLITVELLIDAEEVDDIWAWWSAFQGLHRPSSYTHTHALCYSPLCQKR